MLVCDRMTSAVVTVEPETQIFDAMILMKEKHIRRLAVMKAPTPGRWTDFQRSRVATPAGAVTLR